MPKKIKDIADLTLDSGNSNAGTERGAIQVENSLREYGAGRSIVTDKNGVVIAGNKTLESAVDIGLPIEVIQTDGTKLVVVQRTDLELGGEDSRARLLAYADNRTSDVGLEWNAEQIAADLEAGIDLDSMFRKEELDEILERADETELPELPGGDGSGFQQITFTLTNEQVESVKEAIAAAKKAGPFTETGNENSNGNALARLADAYHG